MVTTNDADSLARTKALLATLEPNGGARYHTFMPAEVGLFEGLLAVGDEQVIFVKNRFGTLEAETPLRFADADPRSIRTWESVFGEEVSWMSKGISLRVARLSREDAVILRARLGGAVAPSAAAPVVAAPVESTTPIMPAPEALAAAQIATSIAPMRAPAPSYVPPPRKVSAPSHDTPSVNHDQALAPLPDGAWASAFWHALFAGVFVSLVGSRAGLFIEPMIDRGTAWIPFAISFPLAELFFAFVRARAPSAQWARAIYPDSDVPAIRRLVLFAFAGVFASIVTVFSEVLAQYVGERRLFFWVSVAALGAAIAWVERSLPWRMSAIVLAGGGFFGWQVGSALLRTPIGPFVFMHVSLTVTGAWFAHAMWVQHRSRARGSAVRRAGPVSP